MKISILGCGWLGLPLAKKLIQQGHKVKGSTTSSQKLKGLIEAGIEPFQIKVVPEGISGDFDAFLDHSEVFIADIPPKLKTEPEGDFVGKVERIVDAIENTSVQKVIFVSSISVYENTAKFPEYIEIKYPNGTSKKAKQLISAEREMARSLHFRTCILRFGGLIGEDRHPINQLSGTENIKNPKAPVNLIHQEDCIGIISRIIEKNKFHEIYNAVYPEHPSKEEYYGQIAKKRNLPLPNFDQKTLSVGKIINSSKLETELKYRFQKKI